MRFCCAALRFGCVPFHSIPFRSVPGRAQRGSAGWDRALPRRAGWRSGVGLGAVAARGPRIETRVPTLSFMFTLPTFTLPISLVS